MSIPRLCKLSFLIAFMLTMTGCMRTSPSHVFENQTINMKDIYTQQQQRIKGEDEIAIRKKVIHTRLGSGMNDEFHKEHVYENEFIQLSNPALTLNVLPRIQGSEQLPVPGFTTTFSLYERTHYALQGEAL